MIKNSVPPHPINYAVWYEYVEGRNAGLNDAIGQILNSEYQFTENASLELYKKHICNASAESFEKINLDLQILLNDAVESVASSSHRVASVGENLEGSALQLQKMDNFSDANAVISDILEETKQFSDITEKLKAKLNRATDELLLLRTELTRTREIATRDGLTGLLNRRALDAELSDLVENSLGSNHCILMLDLDNFKHINDTYGHVVGDKVIRFAAGILKKYVALDHIVARYGGEEMVVIMPNTEISNALEVAEMIRSSLSKSELKQKDSGQSIGKVTISIGVTALQVGDSVESFVARADKALYAAKKGGRNKVMQG
ncbi:MAG: GGDEF domain-containing protein [Methyloprofundus sp.]|nr:GGDEF domain-containing protein [Methyloprofundus sp.]